MLAIIAVAVFSVYRVVVIVEHGNSTIINPNTTGPSSEDDSDFIFCLVLLLNCGMYLLTFAQDITSNNSRVQNEWL